MNVIDLASRRQKTAVRPVIDYAAVALVAEQWAKSVRSDEDRKTIALIINFARDLADSPKLQQQFDEMLRDFFCDYCSRSGHVVCQGPQATVPCAIISEWRNFCAAQG